MTGVCEVNNCQLVARVKAGDVNEDARLLCVRHWNRAPEIVPDDLHTIRVVDLPACFVYRCKREVVTIVGRYDERPRHVCQRHLDDLSWVDLPQELSLDRRCRRG